MTINTKVLYWAALYGSQQDEWSQQIWDAARAEAFSSWEFAGKEEYLQWVKDWKTQYAQIAKDCRQAKQQRKRSLPTYNPAAEVLARNLKSQAHGMLLLRKEAKRTSWQMKQASKAEMVQG